jgi:hypothetical protein
VSIGPITDAERRGWQIRDVAALADLLEAANMAGLPPIGWRMSACGGWVGEVSHRDPVREVFGQWAAFLAARWPVERWPDTDRSDHVHLHVNRKLRAGQVDVTVIADIYDENEAGSG